MDRRIVNIADDLPASMLDLVALGGGELPPSSEPLQAPWAMQVDTSRSPAAWAPPAANACAKNSPSRRWWSGTRRFTAKSSGGEFFS